MYFFLGGGGWEVTPHVFVHSIKVIVLQRGYKKDFMVANNVKLIFNILTLAEIRLIKCNLV